MTSTIIAAILQIFSKSRVTERDPTKSASFVPAVTLRTLSECESSAGHEPSQILDIELT